MFERFEEHVKKAGEKAQEKPPSRIEVVRGEEKEILDLIVEDGAKKFSVKEYAPPAVSFKKNWAFAYYPEERVVGIRTKELPIAFGRLALLHEIGHAIDYEKHPEFLEERKKTEDTERVIRRANIDVLAEEDIEYTSKLKEEERNKILMEKFYENVKKLNLPQDELKNYIDLSVRLERGAHAEALNLYRKIKKDKEIDLLAGLKNKDIIELTNYSLKANDDIYRFLYPEERVKLFLARQAEE